MILFHAKRDGTVTTTPNFVPQGSSMQDLVVVSEFDYAYCAIKLLPASGEYIEDTPCTPILQKDFSTIFTAPLPPKATVVAGSVDYQLIFTAADGTPQTTLTGSFTVPRGVPVSTPGSVEELAVKTINDIYTIMANTYGLFVGHERDIYQSLTDIAALKKTVSSAGYVTIPTARWNDGTPTIAEFTLDGFGAGMTAMLIPADSNTQTAAREARLSAYPVAFPIDSDTQTVEIIRADADKAPDIPLRFAYLILKTSDTAVAPSVAIIGVDAYGGGAASGVDESAVRAIITAMLGKVDNVLQYSEKNPPPYPVTSVNGKTGAVNLVIPSKAADVKAEEAGAVGTHNADQAAHPYLSGRVANALDRIGGHDTDIEEINTSMAERLKTADLAAKLDAYKAAQGLVSNTTSNLVNYYLKNEIYTKEEVAALISAIPKFEIKVVTSLPTSNISPTTVYLVKDTTEGGGLYTEYIYVNGAWEELGSQSLDLSGYVTDEELDNLLKSYATLTKVSELIADALKPYATDEEVAEAIRVATVNLVTGSQVTTAINEALKSYYTSAQVDAQIAAKIKTALAGYVPKEDGKGLSKNDYTDADKAAVTKAATDSASALARAETAESHASDAAASAAEVRRRVESGELDGDPGHTPIYGVDYWKPEDVAAIKSANKDMIMELLAERNQMQIPVVDSTEAMTDTNKIYLMEVDGQLRFYAYKGVAVQVPGPIPYTNLFPTAKDSDRVTIYGDDYDGDGKKDGYLKSTRLSGSTGAAQTNSSYSTMMTTGYIPASPGKILRVKGRKDGSQASYVVAYDSSNARTGSLEFYNETNMTIEKNGYTYNEETEQHYIPLASAKFGSNFNAVRICCGINPDMIVTVGTETDGIIKDPETVTEIIHQWADTGAAVDIAGLEARMTTVEKTVEQHTEEIAELQKGIAGATSIRKWSKPIYDTAPVTLLGDDRVKQGLTAADYTVEAVYAKYDALMSDHPRYITLRKDKGESAVNTANIPNYTGHEVRCYEFREPDGLHSPNTALNENKPKIILMSGVHYEYAGVYSLYYALEEIATNPDFDDIRRNAHIIVIPCASPCAMTSGRELPEGWSGNVNANGVEIHCNFGVDHSSSGTVGSFQYGGANAYSEPETEYINTIVRENQDAIAFVSCHNNDYDTVFGHTVIWASSATPYMCNLAFRLADKLSKAWLADERYGNKIVAGVDAIRSMKNADGTPKYPNLAEGEYRLGRATMSSSPGTEQKNALQYNIQGVNLEVARIMRVFNDDATVTTANVSGISPVMTHGAEVYANFIRAILGAYQPYDKRSHGFLN